MNSLRKFADSPGLRPLLLRPKVRSAAAKVASTRFLLGTSALAHPGRFLQEVFLSARHEQSEFDVEVVELRNSSVKLALPPTATSLELLYEIFIDRCYEPSEEFVNTIKRPDIRILDVGANCGVFAGYALSRWPTSSVVCVEPDPMNLRALRKFRDANPQADITIIEAAATTFDGEVSFESGMGAGSLISERGKPVVAVDFFSLQQGCDLVKMDIERGEWPILEDPRMSDHPATGWVMEYHRRCSGDLDAADTAISLLQAAGFKVDEVRRNYWGHGLIKASRTAKML